MSTVTWLALMGLLPVSGVAERPAACSLGCFVASCAATPPSAGLTGGVGSAAATLRFGDRRKDSEICSLRLVVVCAVVLRGRTRDLSVSLCPLS